MTPRSGRSRARKFVVPKGFAPTAGAPFGRALDIGGSRGARRYGLAAVIALLSHGVVAALAVNSNDSFLHQEPEKREVPVVVMQKVEPKPLPVPTPAAIPPPPPEPAPAKARRAAPVAQHDSTPPPSPAAAQAGKVITAAADPAAPADFTDFTMVTGEGKSYAGGTTASDGKSTTAVSDPNATGKGVVGGTGDKPAPSLARAATPSRREWSCTWPSEEQSGDVSEADVTLRVHVNTEGEPDSIDILNAPKPTFATAAKRCALTERYRPALNEAGQKVTGVTSSFVVHFTR
jgi:protein TonB